MKTRILFSIILISILLPVFVAGQENLDLPKPGLTPDSPLYFFDTISKKISLFLTFDPIKKSERALKFAEERLAESKVMAEKNKAEAISKSNQGYQKFLNIANTKAQEAKEKGKNVEDLAILITEKTLKHQEVLVEVFKKVPEETKSIIEKAIQSSRKGSEEAVKAVTGVKRDELLQKIEEIKTKVEEEITALKEKLEEKFAEVEKLKKEVELLKEEKRGREEVMKQQDAQRLIEEQKKQEELKKQQEAQKLVEEQKKQEEQKQKELEKQQTEEKKEEPEAKIEEKIVGQLGTFYQVDEEICKKDGQVEILMFSTSWCPHCIWAKPIFEKVAKNYLKQGKIYARNWELDLNDDSLTSEKETAVPAEDKAIYEKYNPAGSIPTFVFGCKYFRIGTGHGREEGGELKEEKEFRTIIDQLLQRY